MDVGVKAFGVADVLEDPSSKVHQAAVLGQHQPRPRVTLSHIKGRDRHGTPNLMHSIDWFTSEDTCPVPMENQVKLPRSQNIWESSQQNSFEAS